MKTKSFDVIISGAGPVGLFLACELALAKCSVLILEKAATPSNPMKKAPFGIRGLNSLSIEALDRRGFIEELEVPKRIKSPHAHGGEGARKQVGHFAGIPFHQGDIDEASWNRLSSSAEPWLVAEMEELETVFAARAVKLGVEILRASLVDGIDANENSVVVISGESRFEAKWLVGCDGARGNVRKLADFEFQGTEPEFTGYSLRVEIAEPNPIQPGRHLTRTGLYMQSQPGFLVMQDFDGGAFHSSGAALTREYIEETLRRISELDVRITRFEFGSTWTDRARQATRYRVGRVLLAGDAAHIHSPLGGQGLNLGLGDAMNLGWKLAAVVQGRSDVGLLDTYEAERQPLGEQVLDWSRAQVAVMKPNLASRALNSILRDLMQTQDASTYFAGRVWGIHTHYKIRKEGDHEFVGHRAPNFEFEDGTTLAQNARDGRWLFLNFGGETAMSAPIETAKGWLRVLEKPVREGRGLKAMLVRPDGFVAWAA